MSGPAWVEVPLFDAEWVPSDGVQLGFDGLGELGALEPAPPKLWPEDASLPS